jgi:hypothetical protein
MYNQAKRKKHYELKLLNKSGHRMYKIKHRNRNNLVELGLLGVSKFHEWLRGIATEQTEAISVDEEWIVAQAAHLSIPPGAPHDV